MRALIGVAFYEALRERRDKAISFAGRAVKADSSCWECYWLGGEFAYAKGDDKMAVHALRVAAALAGEDGGDELWTRYRQVSQAAESLPNDGKKLRPASASAVCPLTRWYVARREPMTRPKALVSWSSGKDSAYALWQVLRAGDLEVVGVLTTITAEFERVSMHGVREALLDRQVAELGLSCRKVLIPSPCSNEEYEAAMGGAVKEAKARGVTHFVFGDLFLEDIRAYREAKLGPLGMQAVFPLWGRETQSLARDMFADGLRATTTCVDPRKLAPSFAGRSFDAEFLRELPEGVDACGEHGEFHTVVTGGPMFRNPIDVRVGDVVERDGFVFADVLPVDNRA